MWVNEGIYGTATRLGQRPLWPQGVHKLHETRRGGGPARRETRRGGGSVIAQMRSRHIHSAEMNHARVCNDGDAVRITDNNGVC